MLATTTVVHLLCDCAAPQFGRVTRSCRCFARPGCPAPVRSRTRERFLPLPAARSQVSCHHPCPCCHPHPGTRRRQEAKASYRRPTTTVLVLLPVTCQAAKPASRPDPRSMSSGEPDSQNGRSAVLEVHFCVHRAVLLRTGQCGHEESIYNRPSQTLLKHPNG